MKTHPLQFPAIPANSWARAVLPALCVVIMAAALNRTLEIAYVSAHIRSRL